MAQEMQQNRHLPVGFCLWILLVQRSFSNCSYFSLFKIHLSSLFRCFVGEGSKQLLMGRLLLPENCCPRVKGCCGGDEANPLGKHIHHTPMHSIRRPSNVALEESLSVSVLLLLIWAWFSCFLVCFSSWTAWVKHTWGSRGTVGGKMLDSS